MYVLSVSFDVIIMIIVKREIINSIKTDNAAIFFTDHEQKKQTGTSYKKLCNEVTGMIDMYKTNKLLLKTIWFEKDRRATIIRINRCTCVEWLQIG